MSKKIQDDSTLTSARRLHQELASIKKNPPPLCTAALRNDDIYEWIASINGPPDTVYEGGVFILSLSFQKTYPFKPPKVKFVTQIYHCNVDKNGNVCLDLLQNEYWSAAMTVYSLLVSLCSLISDCNPDSPLRIEIAMLYRNHREDHDRRARAFTRRHAFPQPDDTLKPKELKGTEGK